MLLFIQSSFSSLIVWLSIVKVVIWLNKDFLIAASLKLTRIISWEWKQQRHLHGNNCNTTSGSSSECMQRMASSLLYSVHSKSSCCTASMECPLHDAWVDSMENKLLPMQYVPTLHINKVTKEKAKASTTWHLVMSQKLPQLAHVKSRAAFWISTPDFDRVYSDSLSWTGRTCKTAGGFEFSHLLLTFD